MSHKRGSKSERLWICPHCDVEFDTRQLMRDHIRNEHHGGQMLGFKVGMPSRRLRKCEFCQLEKVTTKSGITFHKKYCKKNPMAEKFKAHELTEITKNKLSLSMKKAHEEGRAWNIGMSRWNNEPSYPEKFFMKVIENEFEDKNYQREYPLSIYSLDFAWPEKMKCIEIDGAQHQRFDEYRERDKRKDLALTQAGWKCLRITWKDFSCDTQYWIQIAKKFIDSI